MNLILENIFDVKAANFSRISSISIKFELFYEISSKIKILLNKLSIFE